MFCGDSAVELLKIKDNSVDMLCSDPPYAYGFMGKKWDQVLPDTEIWRQSYRVLKPGAFITVMAAPRTDVLWRISRDLEEAGFDLSFTNIEWVYHSGFPKATDISKSIDKRGGAFTKDLGKMLKDAREAKGLSLNDVAIHFPSKTGGVTGCVWNWESGTNYPTTEQLNQLIELLGLDLEKTQALYGKVIGTKTSGIGKAFTEDGWGSGSDEVDITEPESDLAKKYEGSKAGFQPKPAREIIIVGMKPFSEGSYVDKVLNFEALPDNIKMTYPLIQTPKPAKKERNFGMEQQVGVFSQRPRREDGTIIYKEKTPEEWAEAMSKLPRKDRTSKAAAEEKIQEGNEFKGNIHPTIKPIKLMSYLITLFTRPGDWVLDPFGGSGTTGLACKLLDRNHIYIDFTEEYYDIAQERLQVSKEDLKKLLKEKISNGQQELF
jgi:site-specific DNA-methyltransferase (adenine-specific)